MTLTDILGTDGAAADPGHIASIAARFDNVARDSDHARQLLSTGSPIQWTGQASELFEQHLSQLPEQLTKVSLSIGHAAGALWTYSNTLEEILPQARHLATQLDQIRNDIAVNKRLLSTATDPTQVKHLNQQIASLHWDERTIRNKASGLRTWLSDSAAVCVDRLGQASHDGIQNSWIRTVQNDVAGGLWVAGFVFDHVVKAVQVFVKVVITPFEELYTTVKAFVAEPSWSTAAPMFRAAGDVTAEVALIATVVALCLTGVGAPAAGLLLSSAATVTSVAGYAGLAVGTGAVVSDVMMMKDGHKVSALDLGTDIVGVVSGGASKVSSALAKKELAKAAKRATVKQTASQVAKQTKAQRIMAQTIKARIVSKSHEVGVAGQFKELQVLGKLNVFPKHVLALGHYPLVTHVSRYLELDKVLVSTNFRAFTIADHVIEGADHVKDAFEKVVDFETSYGQAVNP
jgi:hypothetical protein